MLGLEISQNGPFKTIFVQICFQYSECFRKTRGKYINSYTVYIYSGFRIFQNKNIDGVEELLSIYENTTQQIKDNVPEVKKFPLIVLEGLDGCGKMQYNLTFKTVYMFLTFFQILGKTSVSSRFAAKIGAQRWKTPPVSISHIRDLFDEHLELRTAYYSLGNYIAGLEVQNLLQTTPVVMDR